MKRLAIIGCGDLGKQIAYHAFNDKHFQPVGFFDDNIAFYQDELPILGRTCDIESVFKKGKFDVLMIGIGYLHPQLRASYYDQFKDSIPFGTIIHSSAYVDKSCIIGSGVLIYPRCSLDMNVVINDNVLINIGCIIAHDTIIGQHSFLSPSVSIAGFVKIGQNVNLGIGTIIIDHIKVANNIRTGGGAVIIKNLESPGLYVGIPAVCKKQYNI